MRAQVCDDPIDVNKALLILALLAAPACEKPDNTARLQDNAAHLAAEYRPTLDQLHHREQALIDQGRRVPPSSAGLAEARQKLMDADHKLTELEHAIGRQTGGGCELVQQADALAKAGKTEELATLVDTTRAKLVDGTTEIISELDAVETWVWYALNARPEAPAPTPAPAAAPAAPTPPPATP